LVYAAAALRALGKPDEEIMMPRPAVVLSFIVALALAGCEKAAAPAAEPAVVSPPATAAPPAAAPVAAAATAPAAAPEAGSGTYAADCKAADQGYAITLTIDSSRMTVAEVVHAGKTYANQLTAYSFRGAETPSDFLVAVLFDQGNAPEGVNAEDGRIELWKADTSYYALIDGDKAKKLSFCAG
jgi:hypothetical protein